MRAAHIFIAAFCVFVVTSCGTSNQNAVAHLGDAVLTLEELRERIPNNISAEDSFNLVFEVSQRLNESRDNRRSTSYFSKLIHDFLIAGISKMYAPDADISQMTKATINTFV
ncbi:MAG: hypothetical protein RL664_1554, partial [Bacteroidota bacterium]